MSMNDFKDDNWNKLDLEKKKKVLHQALRQEKWEKLTREQRVIVAEHLGSYSETVLGMPQSSVPVTFGILPAGYKGGYDSAANKIILSYDLLSNDKKADLINTTFHEERHAYQAAVVKNPNQYPEENQEQITKWRENQPPCYASAISTLKYMYITQAIERDAFVYSNMKTDDFMSAKVFDAERPDYEKCKSAWNDEKNEWKVMAEEKLGNDCIRKTDIRIKSGYLGYQFDKIQIDIPDNCKIAPRIQKPYFVLRKEVREVAMLPASELNKMNQQQMQDMEQRLTEVEQKLADFQKKWGHKINYKSSSQSSVRADRLSDPALSDKADKNLNQTHSVKIGEFRSILNDHMDKIIAHQKELNRKRDRIQGDPLTKSQAEALAASDYVRGTDKQLDQEAQELQIKRNKLIQTEKDIIAFGKEHGFDKTLWRKAPEIFKGQGLKYYEASLSTIENNKKALGRQEIEIQTKKAQLQERLNTPEAYSYIAKKREEYLAKDKERLSKIEPLNRKLNDLNKEQRSIIGLKNAIPSRNLERTINVQGDSKDIKNILEQTNQIIRQSTEMQQTMVRARSLSR